ncbi:endonuclease IV-like protein [Leptotrombidium deliense]|uniref:Endonuclease IV-like protein n=1 Tax=Leptotrombidium deliense TaxID=299467 RepID=A0A443SU54_9ACAR|nr:endonuclease IV-like protein [Leptotrombidium deliense]
MPKRTRKHIYSEEPTWREKKIINESKRKLDWFENSKDKVFVGAHFSTKSCGLQKVIRKAYLSRSQAVAFVIGSRQHTLSEIPDTQVKKFRKACEYYRYPSHLLCAHASITMNLAASDKWLRNISLQKLLFSAEQCDRLNVGNLVIHCGSMKDKKTGVVIDENVAIERVVEYIDLVLEKTNSVNILLENTCNEGNRIGGNFEILGRIIKQVKNKERIGICLDTCHAFVAGYDLRRKAEYERMINDIDLEIGLPFLKTIHLNDSESEVNSKKDRHRPLGEGLMGDLAFHRILTDNRLKNIPMIMETSPKKTTVDETKFFSKEMQKIPYFKELLNPPEPEKQRKKYKQRAKKLKVIGPTLQSLPPKKTSKYERRCIF